jgi:hypothetical protein
MLLQYLRALSKAAGGAGSIWKYIKALARATGVSGRFAYGFRTELHFADEELTPGFSVTPKNRAIAKGIIVPEHIRQSDTQQQQQLQQHLWEFRCLL